MLESDQGKTDQNTCWWKDCWSIFSAFIKEYFIIVDIQLITDVTRALFSAYIFIRGKK